MGQTAERLDMPETLIYSDWLYIPKDVMYGPSVKAGLTFMQKGYKGDSVVIGWAEDDKYLMVPRGFYDLSVLKEKGLTVETRLPKHPMVELEDKITLDFYKYHEARKIQHEAFAALKETNQGVLSLACVAGDTSLYLSRGGKGFQMSIAKVYERLQGGRYSWDKTIPTKIRSCVGDHVGLHLMKDVVYKGKKPTLLLSLEDGKTLRLTEDHKVLTDTGFVPAGELTPGVSRVVTDGFTDSGYPTTRRKKAYRRLSWYPAHPHARRVKQKHRADGWVLEEHRAVAEAHINGIPFATYRAKCKAGDVECLAFIDPSIHDVHHKDGNIKNNSLSNLEVLPKLHHERLHSEKNVSNFGHGRLVSVKVASLAPYGEEDVYDVVCEDPHRNFSANGLLVHNCGLGKTVVALKYICQQRTPAIVVVETLDLLEQWIEAIREHIRTPFTPGIIQGPIEKWTWKRPITIAMIQTLARHADDLPQALREHFGVAVYDEVHHLSSQYFVKAAPLFYGRRIGLTATPKREDGLERLYYSHIGEPFFKYIKQPLTPKVFFYGFDLPVDWNDRAVIKEIVDVNGELSFPKLWGFIGKQQVFIDRVVVLLLKALADNRKILVLSHRKQTLSLLHDKLNKKIPEIAGLIIGDVDRVHRRTLLKKKRIVLGIMQLAKEGLDEKSLDTLFLLEPFKAEGVLQQTAGRILRPYPGKKQPIISVMRPNHEVAYALCNKLRRHFKKWPTEVSIQTLLI